MRVSPAVAPYWRESIAASSASTISRTSCAKFPAGFHPSDFARHEIFPAPWRLVIVKNTIANKESVRLSINACQLRCERFGAPIWARRPKRGVLRLRRSGCISKNFRARSMIKLHRRWLRADDFQQPQRCHARLLACRFGNFEAQTDMALPGQMIDLCRGNLGDNPTQGSAIGQIAIVEK